MANSEIPISYESSDAHNSNSKVAVTELTF